MAVYEIARTQLTSALPPHVASVSQRLAIEAPPGPTLVLAGPGAGKTFCLIERIRFLIEELGVDPTRICAFTFTNKAADEIATRLARQLGARAEGVKRRTIHAFCAELLREYGSHVNLPARLRHRGRGLPARRAPPTRGPSARIAAKGADAVLRAPPARRSRSTRTIERLYARYEELLSRRNVVDFDTLVVKAAELLEQTTAAAEIRARWNVLLVDEFQDLNPEQYRVIHALAREHRHVFAVGDDEQSIYALGRRRSTRVHELHERLRHHRSRSVCVRTAAARIISSSSRGG